MIRLSSAAEDIPCVVNNISLSEELRKRLGELGIIPETVIIPLFSAPSGEPRVYLIRGAQIALRRDISDHIWVTNERYSK